ncbi:endonuclease/exonuclease/phosphatase family protein [Roseimicrobium sp. ORNL1]|uniref:endonuclease/exonuclease/phosphatase family protein n=1 Tax=Roseimicrobium sp. ORNL1 TaxID=2711231 RepID=UPI0013E1C495|nr:endonuclease/exonuclease/phosphatase family protein [Roseimicrobium sp. ORNL1]QIF04836.1 endonuclease/exonuclease/phosphatase family protein [Roseimicrobium sp. ORNL1]
MNFRTKLHRTAGMLGCLLLLTGMLLHLTVRDEHTRIATLFYAMPLPLIMLGWLIAAAWHFRRRMLMVLCLALALVTGFWWQSVSYKNEKAPITTATQPAGARLKVLYWNMAYHRLPSEDLDQLIAKHLPDIVGLGEVGLRSGDPNPLVRNLPPGYTAVRPEHGMAFIVRGAIQVKRVKKLKGRSKFVEVDATVDGRVWHLVLVDGDADPLLSREELLETVLKTSTLPGTLVMGDFNTPLESVWFDRWRAAGLHHASEGARQGFRETWPRHWPFLTIDHVWCTPETQPLHFERVSLPSSDHLAIVTSLK